MNLLKAINLPMRRCIVYTILEGVMLNVPELFFSWAQSLYC